MKAFYFAQNTRTLRYGDNRPIIVGETHTVDGKPILYNQGLHASKRLIDALACAPGSILYLVELGGEIVEKNNRMCATSRKYLEEFDATDLLIEFSCKCALEVVGQIRPYTRYFEQIVTFLNKPTSKDAARQAAYWASAASLQAYPDARDAAHAALDTASAVYAARDGRPTDAVRDVAYAASHSRDAACAPLLALDAQNDLLTKMVRECAGWDI